MRVPLSRRRRRGCEHGAAAVIVAVTTTVIIGFLAFVTDFGMAYTNKRGLQNGADAAALAVAQEIAVKGSPTATCAQLDATWESPGEPIAQEYFERNHPPTDAAISDYNLTCAGGGTQLTVNVDAAQESTTFFGGVLGADDDIALVQSATAVVAPAKTVVGLRPFGACLGLAQTVINTPGSNHMFGLDNVDYGCGSAAGNWGMLDFNGGSNPTSETKDWIENGYNGAVSADPPVYLAGDPGAPSPGALESAMNGLLDGEIAMPVYDLLSGSGNNAQFRVTGFLSVRLCGWKFNNKQGSGSCFVPGLVPSPVPRDYLQVRYTGFVPVGEISTTCFLSTSACDLGTRLFKLAE